MNSAPEEQERLRLLVENQLNMLALTEQVATEMLTSQTGAEALVRFADAARKLIGAKYCAIGVARTDGAGLEEFLTSGLTPEQELAIGARPRGVGVLGVLLTCAKPLRMENLSAHPAAAGMPPQHPKMESFLGVPIRHEAAVLGSIYLTEKEGGDFTELDELTIQALSMHLAVAIRNWQLLKRQRALVAGLISAQEEERRAVAYDLHDGLTQYVMAAQMHLEAFRRVRSEEDLASSLKYLKEAVVESRRLVNGLRSLALDDMGLAGALEQLVQEERSRAGWDDARFVHNVGGERFDTTLSTALYRVAQEALTNARKHALARRVEVSLLLEPARPPLRGDWLSLVVRDDGRGFDPSKTQADDKHIGLHGMMERVRLLNGKFRVESALGKGTRLQAHLPILEPERMEDRG